MGSSIHPELPGLDLRPLCFHWSRIPLDLADDARLLATPARRSPGLRSPSAWEKPLPGVSLAFIQPPDRAFECFASVNRPVPLLLEAVFRR